MPETLVWKDPLEKEMATHSSILAWESPWTEEPGGLRPTGLQRDGHDWAKAPKNSRTWWNKPDRDPAPTWPQSFRGAMWVLPTCVWTHAPTSPLPRECAYAQRCPAAGVEATGRVLASADRTSGNWVSTSLDGGVWSCVHNTRLCTCVLTRVQLFCNPGECSPPGSSVPGISQARVLEWVAISSSKRVCVFIPKPRHELGRSEVTVAQSCLTLCNPMDYTVHENSPGQNTGVGSLSLLQEIFPTQGLNPGLPPCRKIIYQLSPQGSPWIQEWVAYPFSRGSSQPGNQTMVSCIAGRFFTNWAIREAELGYHIHNQGGRPQNPTSEPGA